MGRWYLIATEKAKQYTWQPEFNGDDAVVLNQFWRKMVKYNYQIKLDLARSYQKGFDIAQKYGHCNLISGSHDAIAYVVATESGTAFAQKLLPIEERIPIGELPYFHFMKVLIAKSQMPDDECRSYPGFDAAAKRHHAISIDIGGKLVWEPSSDGLKEMTKYGPVPAYFRAVGRL